MRFCLHECRSAKLQEMGPKVQEEASHEHVGVVGFRVDNDQNGVDAGTRGPITDHVLRCSKAGALVELSCQHSIDGVKAH